MLSLRGCKGANMEIALEDETIYIAEETLPVKD